MTLTIELLIATVIAVDLLLAVRRGARPDPRRLVSLVCTAGGSLVAAIPMAAALALAWRLLAHLAPAGLATWWDGRPALAFVACFVAWDAAAYGYHHLGHRSRVGWASHRVHHLGASFDMSLVLRQPWAKVHALAVVPWLAVAGFSLRTATMCATLSVGYQALQHTSRSWSLGPLDAVLMTGQAHRRHHTVDGGAANLGAVFVVWDRLFGTWAPGPVATNAQYGTGVAERLDPLRNQLDGWLALAHRPVARSAPACSAPAPPMASVRSGADQEQ
jgi:sterol desaturase/sphingolipid hydroxylase (fatty acid hydroxylase superfamily)